MIGDDDLECFEVKSSTCVLLVLLLPHFPASLYGLVSYAYEKFKRSRSPSST